MDKEINMTKHATNFPFSNLSDTIPF